MIAGVLASRSCLTNVPLSHFFPRLSFRPLPSPPPQVPAGLSKRKMSFTSASMAFGAWPDSVDMCEPTINAALFFDRCPSVEGLRPLVDTMKQYDRCNGVPTGTVGRDDWRIKFVEFKAEDIIRTVKVKSGAAIIPTIEGLLHDSCRGKPGLPWWEIVRVEAPAGQRSAVVLRIDHVIGDGISLVNLMEDILTDADGKKLDSMIPASMNKKFQRELSLSFFAKIKQVFDIVYYFFFAATLGMSSFDTPTKFTQNMGKTLTKYTGKRSLVMFEPMPLNFIKELKKQGGASLNDVMFSALGGAIRRYNIAQDCEVTGGAAKAKKIQCRALMPVSFPRPAAEKSDKSACLRNKWVFLSADLCVGNPDPLSRLRSVNSNMTAIKNSPYAPCQLAVQTGAKNLPTALARQTVVDIFQRHSVVFSNVPGPDRPCRFGGEVVVETQMFFNNLIPQVGILSYNGTVYMNMNADTTAIPGSEDISAYFAQEIAGMAGRLNVEVPEGIRRKIKEGGGGETRNFI